jgi:hypothetical protein
MIVQKVDVNRGTVYVHRYPVSFRENDAAHSIEPKSRNAQDSVTNRCKQGVSGDLHYRVACRPQLTAVLRNESNPIPVVLLELGEVVHLHQSTSDLPSTYLL